jgi:hypothetical protein
VWKLHKKDTNAEWSVWALGGTIWDN